MSCLPPVLCHILNLFAELSVYKIYFENVLLIFRNISGNGEELKHCRFYKLNFYKLKLNLKESFMKLHNLIFLPLCFFFLSCETMQVSRIKSSDVTDISGYWNDTDVRIVCESLIADCLDSPRLQSFTIKNGREPVFIIGKFRNDSSEHIDTSIITKKMQTAIIKSGKAEFVADSSGRKEIRAERDDQNMGNASEDSAKALGNETGADFMLQGSVKSIVQKAGNKTVRTYHISAELINIETNKIIWSGFNDEIKKLIKNSNIML